MKKYEERDYPFQNTKKVQINAGSFTGMRLKPQFHQKWSPINLLIGGSNNQLHVEAGP